MSQTSKAIRGEEKQEEDDAERKRFTANVSIHEMIGFLFLLHVDMELCLKQKQQITLWAHSRNGRFTPGETRNRG